MQVKNQQKKRDTSNNIEVPQTSSPIAEEMQLTSEYIENKTPPMQWANFDVFWAQCIKGGNHVIKAAAEAHLKAIGVWDKQNLWIPALLEYGLPIEK